MFVRSLLFGTPGHYQCLNTVDVTFKQEPTTGPHALTERIGLLLPTALSYLLLPQRIIHKLNHTIACKQLTKKKSQIIITNGMLNITLILNEKLQTEPLWKKTLVSFAGPSGSMAFFTITWIAATALKNDLGRPLTLLEGYSVCLMAVELYYACFIDRHGYENTSEAERNKYNTPYRVALVAQYALGLYLGIKMMS